MKHKNLFLILVSLLFAFNMFAQQFDTHKVLKSSELRKHLKKEVLKELGISVSEADLATYLRQQYSANYFYNWQNFESRFQMYQDLYPSKREYHIKRAQDHLGKYDGATNWKLPFNYKNGTPVNAYALRHLARQHKMVDIAYYHHYLDEGNANVEYFSEQQASLNAALAAGTYERIKDGNGVYEAFRSGYRVLNWLQIHAMFLSEDSYTDHEQLNTVATLLQHAAHLYKNNQEFKFGNHQTRGLSALAMISMVFKDFEGTDVWYKHAMALLQEHLEKEINSDGFQFERSIHYHMSDIKNFYYVYRLAQINGFEVPQIWEDKLRSLFTTLTKVAYPNKTAPVLQDDTDIPWAEYNEISAAITLGYLLFEESNLAYFADKNIDPVMYWYVTNDQLEQLKSVEATTPTIGSVSFDETAYYISRTGWEKDDAMLIISAGVDEFKPDHQHGDVLGIQGMAYGKVMLPNYQVRYSLKDYGFFKNSMVKNVALVDDELQGKQYTSNKGGSGFGKFLELPVPTIHFWETSDVLDAFSGSHNGFENVGVSYSRQVISVKDGFWIVKDNFKSDEKHAYKQVWQGHYSHEEGADLIRATFDGGEGLDIFQLNPVNTVVSDGTRGKGWSVVTTNNVADYSFISILYPYKGFDNRIDESSSEIALKGWRLNDKNFELNEGAVVISKEENSLLFNVTKVNSDIISLELNTAGDLRISKSKNGIRIQNIGATSVELKSFNGVKFSEVIASGAYIEP